MMDTYYNVIGKYLESLKLMSTYFADILEKYKMLNVADIKDYSNDYF